MNEDAVLAESVQAHMRQMAGGKVAVIDDTDVAMQVE